MKNPKSESRNPKDARSPRQRRAPRAARNLIERSRRTVLAIQHVACETPGLIAEVLKSRGIEIRFARVFKGERIPRRIRDYAGLVVMGGPMAVYEQDQYPYLRQEIRLIQDALSERRPILGVCLGSQLLAAALGSAVKPGAQKEIGWHPVMLSRAAAQDALWRDLPTSFTAFHWHGDVFELPRGATALARSKLTDCQAFRYGDAAYGLLFHLEMTERMIARMTRTFRRELREAGLSERRVIEGVPKHGPRVQTLGRKVLARWAAFLAGEGQPSADTPTIRVKRVYEPDVPADGARFLVDRLWPRGLRKNALRLDGWWKELAPSDALRRWFAHAPAKWPEFQRRYFAELEARTEQMKPMLEAAARGPITLLFGAADLEHNNAVALREYLETRMKSQPRADRGWQP